MMFSRRWTHCAAVLFLSACQAVNIATMLFNNTDQQRSATITFTEPLIVDQLYLSRRIDKNNSVDVRSLLTRVTNPKGYARMVSRVSKGYDRDPESSLYKQATVSSLVVDLEGIGFREDDDYAFKARQYGTGGMIYSELFVFHDGRLMYKTDRDSGHWYSNIWVWCCVVFIVFIVLLLFKLFLF